MNEQKWIMVAECYTQIEAEILRGFLEAQEFTVQLSGESYVATIGITNSPMGIIEISVPSDQAEEAKKIMGDRDDGQFETPDL